MSDTAEQRALPELLYVYYCPVCKVGTGDRSWHSLRDGGLFPQNDTEHDCVRVDVAALAVEVEHLREALREIESFPVSGYHAGAAQRIARAALGDGGQ